MGIYKNPRVIESLKLVKAIESPIGELVKETKVEEIKADKVEVKTEVKASTKPIEDKKEEKVEEDKKDDKASSSKKSKKK